MTVNLVFIGILGNVGDYKLKLDMKVNSNKLQVQQIPVD